MQNEMRDRLITLINQSDECGEDETVDCNNCKYNKEVNCLNAKCADYLIANGVILPPCKIGDIVWIVFTPKYPANPSDKGKWFMSQDGVQRIIYGAKGLLIETWNMGTISAKEIDKKLFLTREAAEEKLREKAK